MYAEQENELAAFKERTSHADGYIAALRARVTKLAEREASTEVSVPLLSSLNHIDYLRQIYIRDLELKMKGFTDASSTSEESMFELRKELSRYKDSETSSTTYIASLEQRLGRADADVVSLRGQVETIEAEMSAKDEAIASLQGRLDVFLREHEDTANWKADLEERELRVQELERKMEEWEKVRADTSNERQRLSSKVQEVAQARQSLEAEVNNHLPNGMDALVPIAHLIPPSPTTSTHTVKADDGSEPHPSQRELSALQLTHSDTLVELEEVSSKYRDALREISDLATQLAEAKMHSEDSSEVGSESGNIRPMPRSPAGGRRALVRRGTVEGLSALSIPSSPATPTTPPTARRHLFRHAASTEGLHTRYLVFFAAS